LETTATHQLDASKADAFAQKMLGIFNDASLALMISIGHRTELFDTMATLPPSTVEEIARAARLNERYVREWLGTLVTGRIVDYDPERATYALPAEHATLLTRAASPNNLAVTAQFIPILAAVEDEIVECFRNGGGVPYASYPRFHEVMAEESAQTVVSGLFEHILPLVPEIVERLEAGIDVLDVGCGSGRAIIAMAERFPKSRFSGYDFSQEGAGRAKAEAERRGVHNANFEVYDVAELSSPARFDLITAFDAIHDQAKPARVLDGIGQALRDGGVVLMQDIAGSSHVHHNMEHPIGPFVYAISCLHCMTVSLAAGGAGLGAMWGRETALAMLADAGFANVDVQTLPHDFMNLYYVARKT
jgi:2-polyprenyl-3-methyl-5-hydroxy-6-metoxy-1,4-benzoquinol methylase